MPSKSPAQARLMAAVAHNPGFAKKVGVPQSVGKEFNQADAGTGIIKPKAYRGGEGHKLGGKMHPQDSRRGIGHNFDTDMKGAGSGYQGDDEQYGGGGGY